MPNTLLMQLACTEIEFLEKIDSKRRTGAGNLVGVTKDYVHVNIDNVHVPMNDVPYTSCTINSFRNITL